MDISEWKDLLINSVMFSRLTEVEIDHLLKVSEEKSFSKGEIIFREGDPGEHVYLIGSGVVTIALSGVGDHKLPIETLGPGNFFGEMACIEHKPRMATVVVASDCELLLITSRFFHDLVNDNARFASRFSLILSERLRKLTEEILAVRIKNVDEKLELSNTKLDASLKAIESQMKAAETIFEQTSSRASEVIHSFDRTRTQVILVATAVSLIASMILGLLAFVGWKEWKSITTPIQAMAKDFKLEVEDAKSNLAKINSTADEIDALREKIQSQSKTVENLDNIVKEAKKSQFEAKEAQLLLYSIIIKEFSATFVRDQNYEIFKDMLKVADPNLTEDLFLQFQKGLMSPDKNLYLDLIEKSFDRNYIQTPKQEALSYYYLLAAYLLDDNNQDYIVMRKNFDRFIEGHGKRITILRDLGPSWFEGYINPVSSDSQNALKISRLNEVWNKITQPVLKQ